MGRSPYADIVIADPSVAEHHAEIVVADDGGVFIMDCGTASGTWRLVHKSNRSAWKPLRQAFVARDDVLKLGRHECLVSEILAPVMPQPYIAAADRAGRETIRPGGHLSRDPLTGEIVRRRR